MGIVNKIATCCCCCQWACNVGQCIDMWHGIQSCGFANIQCGNCCWTLCAPICHRCELGAPKEAFGHCFNCLKYCCYGCALYCCAPIDGCINCLFYIKDIFTEGVSGHHNVVKNTEFVGSRIRNAFELPDTPQPRGKFLEYNP